MQDNTDFQSVQYTTDSVASPLSGTPLAGQEDFESSTATRTQVFDQPQAVKMVSDVPGDAPSPSASSLSQGETRFTPGESTEGAEEVQDGDAQPSQTTTPLFGHEDATREEAQIANSSSLDLAEPSTSPVSAPSPEREADATDLDAQSSPSPDPVEAPFDWDGEKDAVRTYLNAAKGPWHQVGYRQTGQGTRIFERGIHLNSGEWTSDMSHVLRVPYHADELSLRQVLIFTESEDAADLLNAKLRVARVSKSERRTLSTFAVATTVAGGLGQVGNTNIAPYAFKRAVIVLPTNDPEGAQHAQDVCRACASQAALQRIVQLPNRPPGGGLEAFLRAGGTPREIFQRAARAGNWGDADSTNEDAASEHRLSDFMPAAVLKGEKVAPERIEDGEDGGMDSPEDDFSWPPADVKASGSSSRGTRLGLEMNGAAFAEEAEEEDTEGDDDEVGEEEGTATGGASSTMPPSGTNTPRPPRPARVAVNFEGIPAEIRELPQWVLWGYEWEGDKYTKVPFQPSGYHARTNHRGDWVDFAAARRAFEHGVTREGAPFDGVGFVLTEELEFVGVDIDKQRAENGEWSPEALEVVQSLASYTEISPSGRGLRVFLRGLRPAGRCKHGNFEIYNTGRYLTVTGHHFPGTPTTLQENQEAIDAFHKEYIAAPPRVAEYAHQPGFVLHPLSNEQVLRRARNAKNGSKFRALYDAGDISTYKGDDSAADAALLAHLAYWTGRNAGQMDELFRQSKLMRPKWDVKHYADGKSYGEGAIIFAVENCTRVCDPRVPLFDMPGEADVPPAPTGDEGKTLPYGPRQVLQLLYPGWPVAALDTEVAHARRIAHYFGGELAFVPELGWLRFDGRRFARDDRGAALTLATLAGLSRYVRAEANHLFAIAGMLEGTNRPEEADAIRASARAHMKHARRTETRRFVEDSLVFAAGHPKLRRTVEAFNIRPWVIGFHNGVWDHGEFRAHRGDDHFLDLCPIEVEMSADADAAPDEEATREWRRVLSRISGGDGDLEQTLQDVAGYALSGASHLRTIPWAYGKKGTGKSTFTELLQTILGKNAMPVSPDKLSPRFDRARLGADLWNRRLAVCSEAGSKQIDGELLKTLSGGDTMSVRQLYKETFDAAPRHTLILVSNDPPRLEAYDPALKDRILALPFTQPLGKGGELALSGGHRIEDVRKQVDSPLVRGFAKWAIEGLERLYQTREIFRAEVVVEASERFWRDTDPMGDFWEGIAVKDLLAGIHGKNLRKRYTDWCEAVGVIKPFGPIAFKRSCENIGLVEKRFTNKNIRGWILPKDPARESERVETDPDTGEKVQVQLNVYGERVIIEEADTTDRRNGSRETADDTEFYSSGRRN